MNSIAEFGIRLVQSNNFRLAVLWILIGIHLVFNLFFLGVHEPRTEFANFSERQQRFYNTYFHGQYQTDREIAGGNFRIWFRGVSWKFWFIELFLGLIYFPIAMREEVGRAWRHARERLHVHEDLPNRTEPTPPAPTGGTTATGTTAGNTPPAQPRQNGRLGNMNQFIFFIKEFGVALMAELIGERIGRR